MAKGNGAVRGALWDPRKLTSFQNFDPANASELASEFGRLGANLGSQEAADAWFLVAAKIAQGVAPPNQALEARCSAAMRALGKAMLDHAETIDRTTEAQAAAVDKARENATGRQKPGGPSENRAN